MRDINKLIYPILKKKVIPGQPLVLVREEYGYKHYFWFPRRSKKEVIKWWKRQPYRGLSGYIRLTKIGELVSACSRYSYGNDLLPYDKYLELWTNLHLLHHPLILKAHIFHDTDTWLIDNTLTFYHAGYNFAKLEEEKNINEIKENIIPLKFYEET